MELGQYVATAVLRDSRTSPQNLAPVLALAIEGVERQTQVVADFDARLTVEHALAGLGMYSRIAAIEAQYREAVSALERMTRKLEGLRAIESARLAKG